VLQDGRDLIVLNSTRVSVLNQNFNLVHALAHHYYYHDIAERYISKEARRNFERRSAKFAAVFLLPKDPFIKDIESDPGKLETYVNLSFKCFVSPNIMITRAYDLKIIDYDVYRKLMDEYDLKRESLKSVNVRQIPALSKATGVLTKGCGLSREDIVSGSGISSNEIEILLHLEPASFKIENNNILEFKCPAADTDL
jgi:Zn-dependent peptidase ImmA (M78 family)